MFFIDRVRAIVRDKPRRDRRRESRLMLGLPLSRVAEVVCGYYEIELTELGRRGNRHPARAALAYLARRRTAATNAELATFLGLVAREVRGTSYVTIGRQSWTENLQSSARLARVVAPGWSTHQAVISGAAPPATCVEKTTRGCGSLL